jgi:hypothetical protein
VLAISLTGPTGHPIIGVQALSPRRSIMVNLSDLSVNAKSVAQDRNGVCGKPDHEPGAIDLDLNIGRGPPEATTPNGNRVTVPHN